MCETTFDFERDLVLCECGILQGGYISLKTDKNLQLDDEQFLVRSNLSIWMVFMALGQLLAIYYAHYLDKQDWQFINQTLAPWQ